MADQELPFSAIAAALVVIGAVLGAGGVYYLAPRAAPEEAASAVEHDHAMHGETDHAEHHGDAWAHPADVPAPTLSISVTPDPVSGWNLHLETTNFRFAPEASGIGAVAGEGHGHLYANGDKLARLYGPWHHIAALPKGEVEITVTLNTNDHRTIAVSGQPTEARQIVIVE